MDGSTICEGMLGGVKLGVREMPLLSSSVGVEHIGKEDILDILETGDADPPTGDPGAANGDNRCHYGFPIPPQAHLGPLDRPTMLQFHDFIASGITSTQMTTTLSSIADQLPSLQERSNIQSSSHSQDRPRTVPPRTLRAVALRLMGYILIPVFCIVPRAIADLIILCYPASGVVIPDSVNGTLDVLNGLVGLFNALLFFSDPVLLVVWEGLWVNRSWGVLRKRTSTMVGSCRDRESRASAPVNGMYPFSLQDVTTPRRGQVRSIQCNADRNESLPQPPLPMEDSKKGSCRVRTDSTLDDASAPVFNLNAPSAGEGERHRSSLDVLV